MSRGKSEWVMPLKERKGMSLVQAEGCHKANLLWTYRKALKKEGYRYTWKVQDLWKKAILPKIKFQFQLECKTSGKISIVYCHQRNG